MNARPALLIALALPALAHAGPVQITNTLTTQYRLYRFVEGERDGEEAGYGLILDRLNLVAGADGLSTFARVDAMYFFEPPTGEFEDDARVERLNVAYSIDDVRLEVGDFYRQLGRGLLLSLRKEDEIGVDVALRGGQLGYVGDTHRAALFAGRTNPSNLDTVNEKFVRDPDDLIAGAEYGLRGLGPVDLGVHGLYLGIAEPLLVSEPDDHTLAAGATAEIADLAGVGSLYLEADWQRRTLAGEETEGYAAYALAELYLGDWVVIAEGLHLDDFEISGSPNSALRNPFVYNQPPTLERIDQEVQNNIDVTGARLRVDHTFLDGSLVVYANGMIRIGDPDEAAEVTTLHAYGGVELDYDDESSRLNLSGGWRDDDRTGGEVAEDIKSMIHFEGDWLHALGGGYAIHLTTLNELRTLASIGEASDYARGSTLAGIEKSGLGALTVEYGYDTQDESGDARNHFLAAIVDWHLSDDLRLRALGGTQRGGLKCIGGVCRIFPEFAGGRLDLIGTFDP